MPVPFNNPTIHRSSNSSLSSVSKLGRFSGNNKFSCSCAEILAKKCGYLKAYMTNSCSSALEFSAILMDLKNGDEVIMPSFTFPSTASAFNKSGAKIVWGDIRSDSKNIDETKLEDLITLKTRGIVVVHYGGMSCNMEYISELCRKHNLFLIEDCSLSIGASFKEKSLGSFGDLAVFSFHETKSIQCGEGGALVINNQDLLERASILYNRGTDREKFLKNQIDHYSWVDSSNNFLMSELQSAFLFPQLEDLENITHDRVTAWNRYFRGFSSFLPASRLPLKSRDHQHNGHIFYIVMNSMQERTELIEFLRQNKIGSAFHYQPLHRAPYWKGKYDDIELPITDKIVQRLIRLPIFYNISEDQIDHVVDVVRKFQ